MNTVDYYSAGWLLAIAALALALVFRQWKLSPTNLRRNAVDRWDERRPLIKLNSSDVLTIGDSFEGIQAYGDTGSGKTSTTAKVFAAAMLRAGYGGLVLTVKPEDTLDWCSLLEENGRTEDALFFGLTSNHCFNFLHYELRHGARLGLGSRNATRILTELVMMAQREAGAGTSDPFWRQSAEVLIAHTLDLITAAGATPSMLLAHDIILSGPHSLDQARDVQWQAQSQCWHLIEAGRRTDAKNSHDFKMAEKYWLRDFPLLPDKTRQSIVATFTAAVAHHFCSDVMHRLFGADGFGDVGSISPDDIFGGKIIIVNLPLLEHGAAGRFASIVWKYCTQLAIQRRVNRERPVFIFSDESHYFLTDYDQTARSYRCATIYLTQNLSNYFAESPGEPGRHRVESMCANLKTQILHQCSHEATRRAFSESIGKHRITQTSTTHQFGHGKTTHSENEQPAEDYWVSPDAATDLRTGAEANRFQVTAIVRKAGKRWHNGKPYLNIQFDQKNLEPEPPGNRAAVAIPQPK